MKPIWERVVVTEKGKKSFGNAKLESDGRYWVAFDDGRCYTVQPKQITKVTKHSPMV